MYSRPEFGQHDLSCSVQRTAPLYAMDNKYETTKLKISMCYRLGQRAMQFHDDEQSGVACEVRVGRHSYGARSDGEKTYKVRLIVKRLRPKEWYLRQMTVVAEMRIVSRKAFFPHILKKVAFHDSRERDEEYWLIPQSHLEQAYVNVLNNVTVQDPAYVYNSAIRIELRATVIWGTRLCKPHRFIYDAVSVDVMDYEFLRFHSETSSSLDMTDVNILELQTVMQDPSLLNDHNIVRLLKLARRLEMIEFVEVCCYGVIHFADFPLLQKLLLIQDYGSESMKSYALRCLVRGSRELVRMREDVRYETMAQELKSALFDHFVDSMSDPIARLSFARKVPAKRVTETDVVQRNHLEELLRKGGRR